MIDFKEVGAKMLQGFKDMFTVDLKGGPKNPRTRNCLECQVIASGFFLSLSGYFYYLTRVSRLNAYGGTMLTIMAFAGGLAPFFDTPPAKNNGSILITEWKKSQAGASSDEKSKE